MDLIGVMTHHQIAFSVEWTSWFHFLVRRTSSVHKCFLRTDFDGCFPCMDFDGCLQHTNFNDCLSCIDFSDCLPHTNFNDCLPYMGFSDCLPRTNFSYCLLCINFKDCLPRTDFMVAYCIQALVIADHVRTLMIACCLRASWLLAWLMLGDLLGLLQNYEDP